MIKRIGLPIERIEEMRIKSLIDSIPSADQPSDAPPPLRRFSFVAGFENHVTAKITDGTNIGTTEHLIALPRGVRRDDQPTGYTYQDWQNRTRDSDDRVEKINAQLEAGDEFLAQPVCGGTGVVVSGDELVLVVIHPVQFWIHVC